MLISADSVFWTRVEQYGTTYFRSTREHLALTKANAAKPSISEATAIDLASGENAPLAAIAAALADLDGEDAHHAHLARIIRDYSLGTRYFADVRNWRLHVRHRQPSLLLQRTSVSTQVSRGHGDLDTLARILYYDGHVTRCLNQANHYLGRAMDRSLECSSKDWQLYLTQLRHRIAATTSDIDSMLSRNRKDRVLVGSDTGSLDVSGLTIMNPLWARIAIDGAERLVVECRRGFGELRHFMRVYSTVHPEQDELHACDLFQRAVVTDVLCDINDMLHGALRPLIAEEVEYLVRSRLTDEIGGWSYCRSMTTLPPDADDLGQVIQVLGRVGSGHLITHYASDALRVLFNECSYGDGTLDTWIIPADSENPRYQAQRRRIRDAGRPGPTPEVMANLLYALALYHSGRYRGRIERGLTAIERMQHPNGYWTTEWYVGLHYGTYVCTRALAESRPSSPAIVNAVRFVFDSQNDDGSWSASGIGLGDPLNTAFAVLTLAAGCFDDGVILEARKRANAAARFLLTCRDDDGWPSCEWLSVPYGSRTITTAYAAKAAISASQSLLRTS